jgi:hypothetical protein
MKVRTSLHRAELQSSPPPEALSSRSAKTISVIGSGGRIYYYAHLDSYARGIEVGDPVTTRTVLGYVGTTGNALGTPPHLHFGVYTLTGAINPLPLLTDRSAPAVTTNGPRGNRTRGTFVSRKI